MSAEATKTDLVITHIFDAPLAEVWQAWSDPQKVMQWWGPDGFSCPLAEIDFRAGGTALVCMSAPQFGEHYSLWNYTEIVPHTRIDYIHSLVDKNGQKVDPVQMGMPADFPQDQRQVIAFKALGEDKTELTVTEYGWTVGQMMEMSRMGMEQCLQKMAVMLKAG